MIDAPLTPDRLLRLEPLIRARSEELLRLDDPDRRIEFVHGYATPLALMVIGTIVGVREADWPMLQRWINEAFRIASGAASEEEIAQLADGQLAYWEYLCALADERRARPRDDFTSALAAYVKDDGSSPTSDEVAVQVNTILAGGFEPAQLMSLAVLSILEHRDQWELLKSDRSLLATAVEECARYRTVNKRNFRVAVADVEVGGVQIPEGSLVAVMFASANRDESAFPDPDRLDITRRVDNLTFGRGMHTCPGASVSRLQLRVTLETLLDRAPDAILVEGQQLEFKHDLRLTVLERLQVDLGAVP
jgi:cytochrome P450